MSLSTISALYVVWAQLCQCKVNTTTPLINLLVFNRIDFHPTSLFFRDRQFGAGGLLTNAALTGPSLLIVFLTVLAGSLVVSQLGGLVATPVTSLTAGRDGR